METEAINSIEIRSNADEKQEEQIKPNETEIKRSFSPCAPEITDNEPLEIDDEEFSNKIGGSINDNFTEEETNFLLGAPIPKKRQNTAASNFIVVAAAESENFVNSPISNSVDNFQNDIDQNNKIIDDYDEKSFQKFFHHKKSHRIKKYSLKKNDSERNYINNDSNRKENPKWDTICHV
jgi:hypothetical protein